jgi:hypothetical protein
MIPRRWPRRFCREQLEYGRACAADPPTFTGGSPRWEPWPLVGINAGGLVSTKALSPEPVNSAVGDRAAQDQLLRSVSASSAVSVLLTNVGVEVTAFAVVIQIDRDRMSAGVSTDPNLRGADVVIRSILKPNSSLPGLALPRHLRFRSDLRRPHQASEILTIIEALVLHISQPETGP